MKKIIVGMTAGVGAFLLGTALFSIWFFHGNLPTVAAPKLPLNDRSTIDGNLISEYSVMGWPTEILSRFNEKALEAPIQEHEACYRLILLPTFNSPLVIRVERLEGKKLLTTKKLNGLGGYGIEKLGRLSFENERELSEEEWNELNGMVDNSEFWFLPSTDRADEPVNDGAAWVLEGSRDQTVHTIFRRTPSSKLRKLFDELLTLASVKTEYKGY